MNLALHIQRPRLFPIEGSAEASVSPAAALACFNPFGGNSESTTSAVDRRLAATDDAEIKVNEASGTAARVLEAGSADLSGSVGSNVNNGLLFEGNIEGDITLGDTAAFAEATSEFTSTLQNIVEQQNAAVLDLASRQSESLSNLTESEQTEGVSSLRGTFIVAMLIIAGLFAAIIWKKS